MVPRCTSGFVLPFPSFDRRAMVLAASGLYGAGRPPASMVLVALAMRVVPISCRVLASVKDAFMFSTKAGPTLVRASSMPVTSSEMKSL